MATFEDIQQALFRHPENYERTMNLVLQRKYFTIPSQEELDREYTEATRQLTYSGPSIPVYIDIPGEPTTQMVFSDRWLDHFRAITDRIEDFRPPYNGTPDQLPEIIELLEEVEFSLDYFFYIQWDGHNTAKSRDYWPERYRAYITVSDEDRQLG